MYELGKYNELTINRKVDFGVFMIDDEGNEVLLPGKLVPKGAMPGDKLEVFVYTDSEDRPVATTEFPDGTVGDITCLEVVDVTRHGAFLNWGLEKDLFLPFKHQNKERHVKLGEFVVVKILHDKVSNRLIATTKILIPYVQNKEILKVGSSVKIQIYEIHERGFVVIVNDKFRGMLYASDVYEDLKLGGTRIGYIKKIRDDGKLDVTLKKTGLKAIPDDKANVLARLREAPDGYLPYNAKSPSEDIKNVFKLSKKAFKKAIGGLYKERKIQITDEGMRRVTESGKPQRDG